MNKGYIFFLKGENEKSKKYLVKASKRGDKEEKIINQYFLKALRKGEPRQYLIQLCMKHFPKANQEEKHIFLKILDLLANYSLEIGVAVIAEAVISFLKGDHSKLKILAIEDYIRAVDKLEKYEKADFYLSSGALNLELGNIYRAKGENLDSLDFYKKAIKLFNLAENKKMEAEVLNNIGILYRGAGRLQKSLESHERASELFKEMKNVEGEANAVGNKGIVYYIFGDLKTALECFNIAMKLHGKMGNKKGIASAFNNMGLVYSSRGNLDNAIGLHNKALELNKEIGDKKKDVITLGLIGNVYQIKGDLEKALECYNSALELSKGINDVLSIASLFGNIAIIFRIKGNFDKALEFYNKSLALFDKMNNPLGTAKALENLGIVYKDKGELDKALDLYNKALKIYKEVGNKQGEANIFIGLGNVYSAKGNLSKALEVYNNALEVFRNLGFKKGEASALNNIGSVHHSKGSLNEALEFFNKALEIYEISIYKEEISNTYNNVGNVYRDKGELEKALDFHEKSLSLCKERGNIHGQALAINNIGNVYQDLGDFDIALKHYEKCLKLHRQIGTKLGEANVLSTIGNVCHKKGATSKSLEFYKESLKLQKEVGNKDGEATTLNNIGNVYQGAHDFNGSLEFYEKALELHKEVGSKQGEALILGNIGNIYRIRRKFDRAFEYYKDSLEIVEREGFWEIIFKSYLNIGLIEESQNKIDDALVFYEKAIKEIEKTRDNLSILDNRRRLSEYYIQVYAHAISASLKLPEELKVQRTFEFVEKSKGRALLDLIFKEIEKTEKEKEVVFKIKGAFTGLSFEGAKEISRDKTILEYFLLGNEVLIFVLKKRNIILKRIKLSTIENLEAIFQETKSLLLKEFERNLRNQRKKYGAQGISFQIKRYELAIRSFKSAKVQEEEPFTSYLINLIDMLNAHIEFGITGNVKALKKILYLVFIKQIEDEISDSKEIYIIPHIYLHLLPFHVLYDEETAQHLIEKFTIKYVPNCAILSMLSEDEKIESFLGIGINEHHKLGLDDLDHAVDEVESAAKILGVKAKLLTDKTDIPPSKENVIRELPGYDLTHFSTHGGYNDSNPLYSNIFLKDGSLEAHEVLSLDICLRNKKIVLSLCESGRSNICVGDDAFSLPVSFAKLGCGSVVATLFSVDDRYAYEFMNKFYEKLKAEKVLANALQKSQSDLSKKYSNELSRWASYYYFGI